MPQYMDVHNIQGATSVRIDQAHAADREEQGKYGVDYLKYWFNESQGKAYCLVDAPSAEAAQTMFVLRDLLALDHHVAFRQDRRARLHVTPATQ